MNRFGRFLINGSIMTVVALLMRTVSVVFNVYISNTIGAEGLGLFTLISTVYSFALTVATSGINLATTRLISEAIGEEDKRDTSTSIHKNTKIKCILTRCVNYSLFFSISVAVILFCFSDFIGCKILFDRRTVSSLRLLSFTLPPIAVSSALSGYFVAVRRVYKNAIVQVLTQFTKIFVTVILFGSVFYEDTESACISMIWGILISELISFIFQALLYIKEKSTSDGFCITKKYKTQTTKNLLGIAIPVALSAYLRSGLISIEHILIPIGLEKSGANKSAALSAYGTVHSMVFPLVLFPSAILASFAGLLVPEISESNAARDTERIKRISSKVMQTALIFSIGVAGIIGCFANELGSAVYPSSDAGKYIMMVAPLIPVMYLDTSVDAILKGLGQQVYIMGVNIIDSALSVILVIILLPKYGILGYIITVYFTELLNASLSITRLLVITQLRPKIFTWIIKPLFSVVASTSIIKLIHEFFRFCFSSDILTLCAYITVAVILYFIFLLLSGTLKIRQLKKLFIYTKKSISLQ